MRKLGFIPVFALWFVTVIASSRAESPSRSLRTQNVILIVVEGMRWQEVFYGADPQLLNKEHGGVADVDLVKREFGQATPEERREALMPFFWKSIQTKGQLLGNQEKESVIQVGNGSNLSYPGYNEILTGAADPSLRSDDKVPNPNVTVWEWLNKKPAFHGQVAAFGTWDGFPAMFNRERSDLPVFSGFEAIHKGVAGPRQEILDALIASAPRLWNDRTFDAFHYQAVLEYLRIEHPRLLFVSFGETEAWARGARYDMHLRAAHSVDAYIRGIWEMLQSSPWYRDRTTVLVTTDHGRGRGVDGWKDHAAKVTGSEYTWLAAIGPDTPALGERNNLQTYSANQIAATAAMFLGEHYRKDFPTAGEPIKALVFPERVVP